nr:SURF1 family protein [Novosphingobium sp. Leaf2]
MALFVGLGVWQVQRLHWKHALIARVDARVHAAPVPLPGDDRVRADDLEYLRVRVSGAYEGDATALVRAATDYGTGYWAMTPLRLGDGRQVWINRGFVPAGTSAKSAGASAPSGTVTVVGLLRRNEPGGSLLQANRPADDRWYSRDVQALAAARRIGPVTPAFVDAQQERCIAPASGSVRPIPGLTQIHFPDNHLMYALTWFTMAALSAGGLVHAWRRA